MNKELNAGTEVDNGIKPIVATSASLAQNPLLCVRAGEDIGVKDVNGNDIFIGSVINHNDNLYLVKYSKKQKEIVARKEIRKDKIGSASWRDLDWIKRVAPYIKIEGTVLFDKEMAKRFQGVIS